MILSLIYLIYILIMMHCLFFMERILKKEAPSVYGDVVFLEYMYILVKGSKEREWSGKMLRVFVDHGVEILKDSMEEFGRKETVPPIEICSGGGASNFLFPAGKNAAHPSALQSGIVGGIGSLLHHLSSFFLVRAGTPRNIMLLCVCVCVYVSF